MNVSNLLITLTDMVSYSRTKKKKKGHIMAQKRKNRAQKALYRLVTIKKYSGWGDYCAFDCSKKHNYSPLRLLRPPGKNLCINKAAKHSLSVMKKQCIAVNANGKYTCRRI